MNINYTIKSGKKAGVICAPHRTKNSKFIVSKKRFKEDYIEVSTYEEIKSYVDKGFKVRMSGVTEKIAPSLVSKESLVFS